MDSAIHPLNNSTQVSWKEGEVWRQEVEGYRREEGEKEKMQVRYK